MPDTSVIAGAARQLREHPDIVPPGMAEPLAHLLDNVVYHGAPVRLLIAADQLAVEVLGVPPSLPAGRHAAKLEQGASDA